MPRILYISKRLPVVGATHAGGQITHYYLKSLAGWSDVHLIALVTEQDPLEGLPSIRSAELVRSRLAATDASSLRGLLKRVLAYGRLLRLAVRSASRGNYDLVVIERSALSWMGPVLKGICSVEKVLLVVHDFWFDRLEADAKYAGSLKAVYFSGLGRVARVLESQGVVRANGIICYDYRTGNIVEEILAESRRTSFPAVIVLPPYYSTWPRCDGGTVPGICFYGNMSRSVNWRSAKWFIDHVLPRIKQMEESVRYSIVGTDPPEELGEYHDGEEIVVTGFLHDPGSYLSCADIFVVPLISGTGIKVKVLEAMASRVPVVANAIGMQGIPAKANRDYLHAESPQEFADQVLKLLGDTELRAGLAYSAWRLVSTRFGLSTALARQRKFVEDLVGIGGRG